MKLLIYIPIIPCSSSAYTLRAKSREQTPANRGNHTPSAPKPPEILQNPAEKPIFVNNKHSDTSAKKTLIAQLHEKHNLTAIPGRAGHRVRQGGGDADPQPVTFENTVFENYCASQYDTNGDGVFTTDEAASVKELTLDANTDKTLSGLNSLAGIEYFTGLEKLSCTMCDFTSIDLSRNTRLQTLSLMYGKLESLDVSQLSELETLNCNNNALTSIDLSHNPALRFLYVQGNQLTALDVSHNPELEYLYVSMIPNFTNLIETLDVTKNPKLTQLYAINMTSLKELRMLQAHKDANILMSVPETTQIIYE